MAEKLRAERIAVETLFFPEDYRPLLNYEYQLDLDMDEDQIFLDHKLTFLRQRLTTPAPRQP